MLIDFEYRIIGNNWDTAALVSVAARRVSEQAISFSHRTACQTRCRLRPSETRREGRARHYHKQRHIHTWRVASKRRI